MKIVATSLTYKEGHIRKGKCIFYYHYYSFVFFFQPFRGCGSERMDNVFSQNRIDVSGKRRVSLHSFCFIEKH